MPIGDRERPYLKLYVGTSVSRPRRNSWLGREGMRVWTATDGSPVPHGSLARVRSALIQTSNSKARRRHRYCDFPSHCLRCNLTRERILMPPEPEWFKWTRTFESESP